MPSNPNRPDWGRYVVREWARHQVARIGAPADDGLLGKCPPCGTFRRRHETAQAEIDETACHVCRVCGDVIDESVPSDPWRVYGRLSGP